MRNNGWITFGCGVLLGAICCAVARVPSREAEAQESKLPFASSIEQRQQSIDELRKLSALMQKQIDVLTSGQVRVTVIDERSDVSKRKQP